MNFNIQKYLLMGIALSYGLSTFSQTKEKQSGLALNNKLIWASGEFRTESVSGLNSMNDGIHYTSLESDENDGARIVKYSYLTGERVAVVAGSKSIFGEGKESIEDYAFSADESKLLITTESESIYRYSSKANYYIYELKASKLSPLTDFKKGKQRLAEFAPNADQVAFVRDNNLFLKNLSSGEEKQATTDGEFNKIINGATDWVYEEEFGFDKGFQWSPDGRKIALYRFDESEVREFSMAMYGELYPEEYRFKYPKAGEQNAQVGIWIYDTAVGNLREVNLQGEGAKVRFEYIPRIKWTLNPDLLCIMRMNRHQNVLEFILADMKVGSRSGDIPTTSCFKEQNETYIDVNDNLFFLQDGKSFLWNSERDGYNHIWQFYLDGSGPRQLTKGNYDVIDFYGIDQSKNTIYYSSSEVSATEQHIYALEMKKLKTRKLSLQSGVHTAVFSKTFAYYINYHSSANTPPYISMHNQTGKMVRVLKDNQSLKTTLAKYNLGTKEFFRFENSIKTPLNAWMIKPPGFEEGKKYPVFVTIYGGPGHNTVRDSWSGKSYLWHQMLAQQGYIVVSCDPRGTQYRGREFKHSTYKQLGKLETEDFIDLAKYLGGLSYVDQSRIGMQGWSYGGYMTALCMTKGADQYKAGISVAPVTNWRYYDSIYTERFMQTPQENADGYDDNSPINHVEKLKGDFLLIHGSADDNVHYQNTMEMVEALVQANKEFDMFIYPNKNHGIYGGNTTLHLYNKMTNFILENL